MYEGTTSVMVGVVVKTVGSMNVRVEVIVTVASDSDQL